MEPFATPAFDEISEIAHELGFALSRSELEEMTEAIDDALQDYRELDRAALAPRKSKERAQDARRPTVDEDPHHAWEWRFELQRRQDGPLAGMTVAIKASIEVAGVPISAGNELVTHVPDRHATVVERLLDSGASILGSTRLTDFENDGAGITGSPKPLPENPARPGYLPGGSSSGSAVVVAAGQVDFAIGGDSGGSIREPASWSGCCGFKPTHSLIPSDGSAAFEPTLFDLGPMARTVEGCARLLSVIADGNRDYVGPLRRPIDGLRVGVLKEGFGLPGESDADVDASARAAIGLLQGLGAIVTEVSVPTHHLGVAIWSGLANEGTTTLLVDNGLTRPEDRAGTPHAYMDAFATSLRNNARLYPYTRMSMFILGRYLTRVPSRRRYALALELSQSLRRDYDEALQSCDVLVMPTTPAKSYSPNAVSLRIPDLLHSAAGSFHNTAPYNATGHPALSVPCGSVDGLPIGLMLVGRHGEDDLVLRVGHAFEKQRDLLDEKLAHDAALSSGLTTDVKRLS